MLSSSTKDVIHPISVKKLAKTTKRELWYVNEAERSKGLVSIKDVDQHCVETNLFIVSRANVERGVHRFFEEEPIAPWEPIE